MIQIKVNCDTCGKEFNISPSRYNKNKSGLFTCSKKCLGTRLTAKPNTKCVICGKLFHRKYSYIKNTKNVCCSYECAYKLRSKEYTGINNHQFGIKGELNSSYKSDIHINSNGYIIVRDIDNPFSKSGMILLHRKIYEDFLFSTDPTSEYLVEVDGYNKKYLSPYVDIHHKDENKLNNTIKNLQITTRGDHTKLHNLTKEFIHDSSGRFIKLKGERKKSNNINLVKKNLTDAGLDIMSNETTTIKKGEYLLLSTDLYISIPHNHVGLIWSRSGLSVKHGLHIGAGCIDEGYKDEVKVLIHNLGNADYTINKGDRIAQLLTIPIYSAHYEEVEEFSSVDDRGGGFGSTGV